MNIIIDAMGGDNAPDEVVRGAIDASLQYNIKVTLVGDRQRIEKAAAAYGFDINNKNIEIYHADEVIGMNDSPTAVVREKSNSSMSVGLRLLKDSGDAFVSAGNTGALHTGSSLIVRKIPGVHRAAIATMIPFERPVCLMDSGANVVVTSDYMEQWAMMGAVYMKKLYGIDNPAVGLLNNGTEESKGTPLMIETYKMLSETKMNVNFVGNVEAKDIPFSRCDVLITDGFTGNIVLKLLEGMGKFMLSELRAMYEKNTVSKVAYLVMKDELKGMKKTFDASEHGGMPLLGLKKPVIKAHGNSDAFAVKNAIRQAAMFAKTGIIAEMSGEIAAETKRNRDEKASKNNNDNDNNDKREDTE